MNPILIVMLWYLSGVLLSIWERHLSKDEDLFDSSIYGLGLWGPMVFLYIIAGFLNYDYND